MKRLAIVLAVALAASTAPAADSSFKGPFGRTRIVAWVVAADPVTSRILVQTPDGRLRLFAVNEEAERRFGTLRVGDEVILSFDDRLAGDVVLDIETVPASARTDVLSTDVPIAALLPSAVVFGAPALSPGGGRTYGAVAAVGLVDDRVEVAAAVPGAAGPGFVAGLGAVPTGVLTEQSIASLGLSLPNGRILTGPGGEAVVAATPGFAPGTTQGNFTPGTIVPGVSTISPDQFGRPTVANQGNFAPGTIAPGVTVANPGAPGRPTVQGNFTPGTVAPGVSARLGNAPPATPGVSGSSGSPGGLTIANPGAMPPIPESAVGLAPPDGTNPLVPGSGTNVATTPGATSPPGSSTAITTDSSARVAPPRRVSGKGGMGSTTTSPGVNTRPAGPAPTGSRATVGGTGGTR